MGPAEWQLPWGWGQCALDATMVQGRGSLAQRCLTGAYHPPSPAYSLYLIDGRLGCLARNRGASGPDCALLTEVRAGPTSTVRAYSPRMWLAANTCGHYYVPDRL